MAFVLWGNEVSSLSCSREVSVLLIFEQCGCVFTMDRVIVESDDRG